jgi:hypothetical protein
MDVCHVIPLWLLKAILGFGLSVRRGRQVFALNAAVTACNGLLFVPIQEAYSGTEL